jgi:hypothetical protein
MVNVPSVIVGKPATSGESAGVEADVAAELAGFAELCSVEGLSVPCEQPANSKPVAASNTMIPRRFIMILPLRKLFYLQEIIDF